MVRRVGRAVFEVFVVVVYLPIERDAVDLEDPEIVLAVGVVVRPEVAIATHRAYGAVNEVVAVRSDPARDDELAVCERHADCGVGRAERVVEEADLLAFGRLEEVCVVRFVHGRMLMRLIRRQRASCGLAFCYLPFANVGWLSIV